MQTYLRLYRGFFCLPKLSSASLPQLNPLIQVCLDLIQFVCKSEAALVCVYILTSTSFPATHGCNRSACLNDNFRLLQGLYYSYYKSIVEAPTFLEGLQSVTSCNITEYPNKVNVLRRFNLYPEVNIMESYIFF